MSKYVRDKAHCRYESYTKDEINKKLNELPNDTIVWFSGDFSEVMSNNKGFNYPTNYNKDNSVLVAAYYRTNEDAGVPEIEFHEEYIIVSIPYENLTNCTVYIGLCLIPSDCTELTEYEGAVG